jgi:LmbE family N-acetylglucosaminyl deacetylase
MLNPTSHKSTTEESSRVETRTLPAQLAAGVSIDEPIAVIVAHPDDETLGLGARLDKLRNWRLVHLSDGAPRDMRDATRAGFSERCEYAQARRQELDAALRVLGAKPSSLRAYGCADQEVSAHLLSLIQQFNDDLGDVSAVITHAYEHGHPDHDAAAFCVHAACALRRRRCVHVPQILEFAGYHLRNHEEVFGQFWSDPRQIEHTANLSRPEGERKRRALACFASQREFLTNFGVERERYRVAPAYDFSRRAPPGSAFYDRLGFHVGTAMWHERVAAAMTEFDLRGTF